MQNETVLLLTSCIRKVKGNHAFGKICTCGCILYKNESYCKRTKPNEAQ